MDDPLDGLATTIVVVLGCISVAALFSALDAALSALGDGRIRTERDEGPWHKAAARYLDDEHLIHTRLLAGRTLCLAGAVALAATSAAKHGTAYAFAAAALVALIYSVVAGGASVYTRRHASGVALRLLTRVRPLEVLVAPFALPMVIVGGWVDRLFPPSPEHDPERVTEADVEQMIEQGEELGSIAEDHASLLLGVLDFHDTTAREIMVPRTQMVAVEVQTPIDTVLGLITDTGHSRYPVYRERADQVVGVLYAKDLFRAAREGVDAPELEAVVRPEAFYVAPTHKIGQLLREMQSRRVHLAIVTDEFGGTAGIITLEDILEEIVGDIQDEHDREEPPVRQLSEGRFLAEASVSLADLEEVIGVELTETDGDFDSLGGLLVERAGRVPTVDEFLQIEGMRFTVKASDARHVLQVEIDTRDPSPEAAV